MRKTPSPDAVGVGVGVGTGIGRNVHPESKIALDAMTAIPASERIQILPRRRK
jgi:hypothetical protein